MTLPPADLPKSEGSFGNLEKTTSSWLCPGQTARCGRAELVQLRLVRLEGRCELDTGRRAEEQDARRRRRQSGCWDWAVAGH